MLLLYRRRWGLFYIPVLVLAGLTVIVASRYWFPLPPRSVAIAAGVPQGGYAQMAELYRAELEQRGITVEIATSDAGALVALSTVMPRCSSSARYSSAICA